MSVSELQALTRQFADAFDQRAGDQSLRRDLQRSDYSGFSIRNAAFAEQLPQPSPQRCGDELRSAIIELCGTVRQIL